MSWKMSMRGGLLVLVGMALLQGCGGTTDRGDDENAAAGGGAGGETATGGTGGKTSSSGGAGSTGTTTTTVVGYAFGEVGTSAVDNTYVRGNGVAPTETNEECSTTSVTGTLLGKPVDQLYDGISYGGGTLDSGWQFSAGFGNTGQAVLSSTETTDLDLNNLTVGTALTASSAVLHLPTSLPNTDSYVCVTGPSSLVRNENHYATTLNGIGLMANCEDGTPVDGEIDLCLTWSDSCTTAMSGSIGGKTYIADEFGYSGGTTALDGTFGTLGIRAQIVTTSATTAALTQTWLTDTTTGNVYCAGAASSAEATLAADFFGDPTWVRHLHFRDLRLVGNCNQVSGSDSLVIRSCVMDVMF